MKKGRLLQLFACVLAAFLAREVYLYYRVYCRVTHQVPSTLELSIQNGYPAEEHKVKTGDGYILTIFRIPGGKSDKPTTGPKPVVLLQHGFFSSSNAFVSIGPKSLGFLLADRGYDVWLGNLRGNRFALEHFMYNTSDPEFWNFSGDEFIHQDIPAIMDYILQFTNNKKLSYVGHSLGASIILGVLSRMPEYNKKVVLIVAMAAGCPEKEQANIARLYVSWLTKIGHGAFLPYVNEVMDFLHPYCEPHLFLSFLCDLIYSIGGPSTQVNRGNLPLITGSLGSTSRKAVLHLFRTIEKERYHLWDSESEEDYPLHLVSSPVLIFYSDSDHIINPKSVHSINKSLANAVSMIEVPGDSFNHLDFIFGESAEQLVYKEIFNTLEKYQKATTDIVNATISEKDSDKISN